MKMLDGAVWLTSGLLRCSELTTYIQSRSFNFSWRTRASTSTTARPSVVLFVSMMVAAGRRDIECMCKVCVCRACYVLEFKH